MSSSNTIVLKYNEINKAFLNYLIRNGWNGIWENDDNNITIYTDESDKLKGKKIHYYQAERLCICLSFLLEVLAKFNKSFLFLDIDDISVINDEWYIINCYNTNNVKVVDIARKNINNVNNIIITNPTSLRSKFMAPEISNFYNNKNKEIPFTTNVSCLYYSIALLVLHITNKDLDDFIGSSLYFFLKRCFEKDANKRFFIFV